MNITKTILPNGVTLVTVPMKDSPAVTVLVMAQTGSKYENKENNGLSHFLEHMVFKGTTKRPTSMDITRELDGLGAQYNAFTSHEYTGYYAKVTSDQAYRALDIVSDIYLNPLFDQKEIDKEKGVIIEEIRMYKDMPHRHVFDVFMELVYGDQPAGWNITGTEETVKSFDHKDFVKYRAEHYTADATTVVVSGSFVEKDMIEKVSEVFSKTPASEKHGKIAVVEHQEKPAVKIEFKETDQTHLVLGVRAPAIKSPEAPALRVMSTILGGGMSSRLFQKLRGEMGVCYYVGSDYDAYTDHGIFAITAGVDTTRAQEVVGVLMEEIKKLRDHGVTEAELAMAKDYMTGHTMLGLETSDAVAEYCATQQVLKGEIRTPAEALDKIRKVTVADIAKVAQDIFVAKHLNLAMVGKYKDASGFERLLKL
jgi:predicted Zn-dependent peptidase